MSQVMSSISTCSLNSMFVATVSVHYFTIFVAVWVPDLWC